MEKPRLRRILLATGAALGAFALAGCGDDGGHAEDGTSIVDPEISQNPDIENYELVEISRFDTEVGGDFQGNATFQESYDLDGNHWECSLTISEGGRAGGAGKSCEVTPLEEPLG